MSRSSNDDNGLRSESVFVDATDPHLFAGKPIEQDDVDDATSHDGLESLHDDTNWHDVEEEELDEFEALEAQTIRQAREVPSGEQKHRNRIFDDGREARQSREAPPFEGSPPRSGLVRRLFGSEPSEAFDGGEYASEVKQTDVVRPVERARTAPTRIPRVPSAPPSVPPPAVTEAASQREASLEALVEERVSRLQEAMERYRQEVDRASRAAEERDREVETLKRERLELRQWRHQEEQRLKEWQSEQLKTLAKEKRLAVKQAKAAASSASSADTRAEIEGLKEQLEAARSDADSRDKRAKTLVSQLRKQLGEQKERIEVLEGQLRKSEEERLKWWEEAVRLREEAMEQRIHGGRPEARADASSRGVRRRGVSLEELAVREAEEWGNPSTSMSTGTLDDEQVFHDPVRSKGEGSQPPVEPQLSSTARVGVQPPSSLTASRVVEQPPQRTLPPPLPHQPQQQPQRKADPVPPGVSLSSTPPVVEPKPLASDDVESSTSSDSTAQLVTFSWPGPMLEAVKELGLVSGDPAAPGAEARAVVSSRERSEGKTELTLSDNSRVTVFRNGTEKEVRGDGVAVVRFSNGDVRQSWPEQGVVVYFYNEARTVHVTHNDGEQVFRFPSGQLERHFSDGTKDISYPDGTRKVVMPSGEQRSTFPDGTTMIEHPDGTHTVKPP
jgi:uncharacterized coiled-coil DUF342 family protein